MRYEFFIALRYLWGKRKQIFLTLITLISIGGVALGVAALIVTLSVMNGFREDLQDKILGTHAHIILLDKEGAGYAKAIETQERLREIEGVVSSAPFIFGQILLRSKKAVQGAAVKGIEPDKTVKVTDIEKQIKEGSLDSLKDSGISRSARGIILGKEIANNLGVYIGEEILLFSPYTNELLGGIPRIEKFQVTGIFDSGMYEYDSHLVYVSLSNAQKLFNMKGGVTGIEVKTDNIYKADDIARSIQEAVGRPYWTRSWMVTNYNLFSALKLEKIGMSIALILIVLVASFNIVSTLILMTIEKTKDIGILKAMGAMNKGIMKIFLWEGGIIGVLGTFFGGVLGIVLCKILDKYRFIKLPEDIYYLSTLPVKLQGKDLVVICLAAIVISLLATLYPAIKASRLNPCEAIRFE